MAKETLLSYLDQQLTKKVSYDTALNWDTKNHTIEIIFRLFGENRENMKLDDADGVVSEEEVILFEDGILLYDEQKAKFDPVDYLATIPFEGKKGIEKAVLDALITCLQEVLEAGQDELMDFLEDETKEIFELHWQESRFTELAEKNAAIDQTRLPYPKY